MAIMKSVLIAVAIAANSQDSAAFTQRHLQLHRNLHPTSLQMCICINCARVTNCKAYHFVEEQHSQPHMNKNPTWEPSDGNPTIQVHIRPNVESNNQLAKMWEEHEDETRRAEEAYAAENDGGDAEADGASLFGSTQYDLTGSTTYEYDVVECADFVEEKDAWVKNMPEEIRLANPHFVPT
jgi:hypothetical protein